MKTYFLLLSIFTLAITGCGNSESSRDTNAGEEKQHSAMATSGSTIISVNSGKCVDVAKKSLLNNAIIQQWTCLGGTNQSFEFINIEDDIYNIRAVHSGLCLNVKDSAAGDGAQVVQYQCGTGTNDQFRFKKDSSGNFAITAVHSGKCLDVTGKSTIDGALIEQWTCNQGANQKFKVATPPIFPAIATGDPELPRVYLSTNMIATPSPGKVISVKAGGDLQAAINAALPGDIIDVQAGATFTGNFTLPKKSGSGWITIRSSAFANLPEKVRVSPSSAALMPKIVTPNYSPALFVQLSAANYRLVGLEIKADAIAQVFALLRIGQGATSLSQYPQNIIIDRSYIHGNDTADLFHCVMLDGGAAAVIDSYLSECHHRSQDSQAISSVSGTGPFKIVNNYLEGAGENTLFGGGDPVVANVVPSDIEFRRNFVTKPASWFTSGKWVVKNLFESKNSRRVLVESNIFENSWVDGQIGYGFSLKSVNQDGKCTWCVTENYTIRKNIVRNVAVGILIGAHGSGGDNSPQTSKKIKLYNNEFEKMGADSLFPAGGKAIQISGEVEDLKIIHNTLFPTSHLLMFSGTLPAVRLVYQDNISSDSTYGVYGSGFTQGTAVLGHYATGYVFKNNATVVTKPSDYPASNFYPASVSAIGFSNLVSGNYKLLTTSPYYKKATDGKDVGADMDELAATNILWNW